MKNKSMKYTLIIITTILVACSKTPNKHQNEKTLAKTPFSELYLSDIEIPQGQDTNIYLKKYINNWVTTELLFNEAEKYLTQTEINKIEKLVADYKKFLYITHYKQFYINKNLDTLVTKTNLQDYYSENKANYLLNENIIKATFAKIPRKAPKIWQVRKWLYSNKDADIELLNAYSIQYADKLDDFQGDWISFNKTLNFFPKQISNQEYTLKHKKLLETHDSTYYYFLRIDSFKLINDTAPLSFIKNKLSEKIIAKRKKDLILQLKNNIFDDAINNHQVKILDDYK
jgi:hypothetical protein